MRWRVAVASLLLMAAPAAASLVESATGGLFEGTPLEPVHYQTDAGTQHDAPDTCAEALSSPLPFELALGGEITGLLVPLDDTADHYRLPIGQERVDGRVSVSVLGHEASLPLEMDVTMPSCGSSVTAAENQPAPPPAHPAPAHGERQVTPHNLANEGWTCSTRWFFVLNQFGGAVAPASIHAVWTDGSQADIPLLKDTPATMAQYATSEHQEFTLESVTANVPAGWRGQFNVAEGPCDAVDGEAVFGDPAVSGDGTIAFTPTVAGTYVLAVRAVPPALPTAPDAGDLLGPQPKSCHAACDFLMSPAKDEGGYTGVAL